MFERANLEVSNSKRWWQFWKRRTGRSEQPDWLAKLDQPFFRSRKDAQTYMTRELPSAVPEGWAISQSPIGGLTWVVKKEKLRPEEWSMQDYSVQVSNSLDFVIFTYGNTDVGPINIHHALLQALVIEAAMLRM